MGIVGKRVSHYEILDKLGEGGMGVVYRAHDTRLDRIVALKFLPSAVTASDSDKQRFIREAKVAASLNHANICTVYSVDEYEGQQYISMEYIEGVTLRRKTNAGSQSTEIGYRSSVHPETVINYAIQIVKGVQAAHGKGIIHRDLKSSNIMVTNAEEIKILDFGLAKMRDTEQVTKTGNTVGTIAYMSPEQVRGESVDERSDIWAIGIILYEMVTGNLPFKEGYDHAVMYSIVNQDPPSISDSVEDVPRELAEIISRCLEKEPSHRYQSTADMLDDLVRLKDNVNSGVGSPFRNKLVNTSRSSYNKRLVYSAGAVLTAGIVLLIFLIVLNMGNWFTASDRDEVIRLMVLPFTNIGDDPTRQVFCDGLVETITSNLSQLEQFHENLWVVPAGEVRNYKISSPADAHQKFGVNYAVTGSLQPIMDKLRLTIQLVDSRTLRQRNFAVIDVDASDVLALHERSVDSLMTMLNLELKTESREVIMAGNTSVSAAFELYMQGIGYLQRYEKLENIDAAIESFTQSVGLDHQFALAYAGLGQAYWRKYDYTRESGLLEKAREQSRTAQHINDRLAQVNITIGMINRGTGRYEEAIKNFNDVLSADPTNADAYRELARVYEAMGDIQRAESTINRSIRLKPDYWAGYNILGAFYFRQNKYDEAVEQFKRVIEITPDNYTGYMNLGNAYILLGRLDEARSMYERSLDLETTYDASSNLATLYYYEGRYSEAARLYKTAIEIHDGDYTLWGNLASAYYWTPDEREKAYPKYERAIKLAEEQRKVNPHDPDIIIDIAGYRAMLGDAESARSDIQKALQMAPNNTMIMYRAGTAFERIGEREKALLWIGQAIEHGYSKSDIMNQPELQDLIADERFQNRFGEF